MDCLITKVIICKRRYLSATFLKANIIFNQTLVGVANVNGVLNVFRNKLELENIRKNNFDFIDILRLNKHICSYVLNNIAIKNENQESIAIGEMQAWIVVKTFKEIDFNEYFLSEGDYIKLGRVRFRIRDI